MYIYFNPGARYCAQWRANTYTNRNCDADSYAKRDTYAYSNADHDTASDTNTQS